MSAEAIENNSSCVQLADKRHGFIINTEVCGAKAKYTIKYTLREKEVVKCVCKRHLNSNKLWLDKIQVSYAVSELSKQDK